MPVRSVITGGIRGLNLDQTGIPLVGMNC